MNETEFLKVKSGDTVLIGKDKIVKVLSFVSGARDPGTPTLFQVINIDNGEITYVNAAEVKEIVLARKGK